MTHPFEISTAARRIAGLACALILSMVALPGCHFSYPFMRQNQFGPALPQNATQADIVARVNDNVAKIRSWRSNDVHLSSGAMPVRIDAFIAVEAPRNFRLMAKSTLGGEEADFGSNDERFWFWVKRGDPPCIYQASHEQMGETEMLRQIPFQPDWLMEVLGVVPLNAEEFSLSPENAREHTVSLTSERLLPSGQPVKRVIQVDTQYGRVLQQSLYTDRGALIAKAKLSDHRRDKESGAILPHSIQIDWPQAKLSLNMSIDRMEINPGALPTQIWELPTKRGYRVVDLGAQAPYAMPGRNGRPAQRRYAESSREPLEALPREQWVMPVKGDDKDRPSSKAPQKSAPHDSSPKPPLNTEDDGLPDWAHEPIPNNTRQRSPSTPQF